MWQDEVIPVLRVLINDAVSPYTYADSRLESVLIVAAAMLVMEIDVKSSYSVSVSDETITPDPAETAATKDVAFCNMLALKAACFISDNEAKSAERFGVTITDGPSTISAKGRLDAIMARQKDMKAKYEKTKLEYLAGNSRAGEAVMTPFTNEAVPVQDNYR